MKNKNIIIILINLIVVATSFTIVFLSFSGLPPVVPLFYSLPWGASQLAPKVFLFGIPAISLFIFLANIFFLKIFKIEKTEEDERKVDFIRESLIFVSLSVSIINLITIVKIVRLFI